MINDFNDVPSHVLPFAQPDRVERLKNALNLRAKSFVQQLFPGAKIQRGEARIGNIDGTPGTSLWIGLDGDKIGQWKEFGDAGGQGGDFISLYAAAERLDLRTDFPRILDELEAMMGISNSAQQRPKSNRQEHREEEGKKPKPQDEPLGPPTATWHYFDENSNVIATVSRHEITGGKTFRPFDVLAQKHAMPTVRPLYNLPIIMHAEPVFLVEGEKCADTLTNLGFAATTAMGGAHAPIEKTNWDAIKGKRIILWPDNDVPGEKWLSRVKPYLEAFGCVVSVISAPAGKPEGWDVADAVKEGMDIKAFIQPFLETGRAPHASRFKIYSLSDLEQMDPPEWMVDGFLPAQGFSSIYGPSGSYKSFIAIDLCLHMAHGIPWCGHAVQQKRILYIAAEGKFGILQRAQAWHRSHNLHITDNFKVLPIAIDLMDPDAEINFLIDDIRAFGGFDVTVVDTVARSFGTGDENSAKDMGSFIHNCDRLRESVSPHVLAIHHSGKDKEKGARGSSSFRAALDTEINVERVGTSKRVRLTMTKQKDAEEAKPINLEAVTFEFPDHHGVIQKSAVMSPIEKVVREKTYVGPAETDVLTVLRDHSDGLPIVDIVRFSNRTRPTVTSCVNNLVNAGFIKKEGKIYVYETGLSYISDNES